VESQGQLDAQLRERGLFFGERPLCSVLRPRFLSPTQYRFLQQRAAVVLRAFRKAHRAALVDDALLAQFRLSDWESDLAHVDPGFRDASPVSRLDAFFVAEAGGLRFTEYNAETPAGGAYNDVLTEVFFGLPIMREFMRTWDLRPLPARHDVLHALLDAYAQWSGTRALPRIAIVDWSDVPTRSEFVLFQDYFTRQGLDCVIVDPREVEYDGKCLRSPHGDIDLVYKRVLLTELVEREGIDHAILRAVKDHKVCMVNPPSCKILHKKASLAVLHDERNAALFDADEQQADCRVDSVDARRGGPALDVRGCGHRSPRVHRREPRPARPQTQRRIRRQRNRPRLGGRQRDVEEDDRYGTRRAVHRATAHRAPHGAVSEAWSTDA
jgi:hypothetical protein